LSSNQRQKTKNPKDSISIAVGETYGKQNDKNKNPKGSISITVGKNLWKK